MSVAKTIADILSNDITDGDPNTVISRNTDFGWDLTTVQEYTYKSLGTLWIGPGTLKAELLKRINYKFGEAMTASEGEISLFISPIESVNLAEPLMSQQVGAESTYVEIVLRQPDGEMSVDRNGAS